MELKEKVKREWEYHAQGYSDIIKNELNSFRVEAWINLIEEQMNYKKGLKVLDIGCGPGFFSIILSKAGHDVIGIDCTENMLKQAKQNAEAEGVNPVFMQMFNDDLDFEDDTFDLIVNRNVTWTMTEPMEIYKEWKRVLKPEGRLLIFDANWHLDKYDEELKLENDRRRKECIEKYGCTYGSFDGPEEYMVKEKLPLEDKIRPAWDEIVLSEIGFKNLIVEKNIIDKVWDEKEKLLYGATPMFMISAEKPDGDSDKYLKKDKKSMKKYWSKRSSSYSQENNEDLKTEKKYAWTELILSNVQKEGALKVLDLGCGPGEFSILMAKAGHQVIGVDMTDAMLDEARINAKKYNVDIDFRTMDIQNLEFEEETFDLIISRNVTWILQDMGKFFEGCQRVLKKDGRIVYFDANWYLHLHDEEAKRIKEAIDKKYKAIYGNNDKYGKISNISFLNLAYDLPMSKVKRPEWDIENAPKYGLEIVKVDRNIDDKIYNEEEKLKYSYAPMFTLVLKKTI